MKKVLLVNPPLPFNSHEALLHPTLSFGYLTPILKKNGYKVKILDLLILNNPSYLKVLEQILFSFDPDFVGFHAHTQTMCTVLKCARNIKKYKPETIIFLGGPHATLAPVETLERNKEIDIIFRYDAEISLIKVLDIFVNNKRNNIFNLLKKINNIGFRNLQNEIILTNLNIINDFSIYPKCDRSIFDMDLYLKNDSETIIVTARGCPGNCNFCATRIIGHHYQPHPMDKVFEEIKDISDLGFTSFFIGDDTFACNEKRLKLFCQNYIKNEFSLNWTSNIRVIDATLERLTIMKKAKAYRVFIGLETFNEHNISVYNKKISMKKIFKAIENIRKVGLEVHGSFIIGCPYDTKDSLRKMIPFIKQLELDVITLNKIFVWPGTPLNMNMKKLGLHYTYGKYWYENEEWVYNKKHPFYTDNISAEDLTKISNEMYYEILS